ncbi:MAG TPA: 30S ribosomal protein S9 [Longimicrobiales bacterium]
MATKVEQYHGTGRRKTSVARVYLKPGAGTWEVNGRALAEYLPRLSLQQHAVEPLVATELQGRFDVKVTVNGGGLTGQAGAIRLGLARALLQYDPELRRVLGERGLLTRDSREVERKKPGRPGARKRFQFSKR